MRYQMMKVGRIDPWHVMTRLYDSEINAGLEADWDGGIKVWLQADQRLTERTFLRDEFDQVGAWLDSEARRLFPTPRTPRMRSVHTHMKPAGAQLTSSYTQR